MKIFNEADLQIRMRGSSAEKNHIPYLRFIGERRFHNEPGPDRI